MKITKKFIKEIVQYTLLATCIAYIISGYGMTKPNIIGPLTFGLINHNIAYSIHNNLLAPFLITLILHMYLTMWPKIKNRHKHKHQHHAQTHHITRDL